MTEPRSLKVYATIAEADQKLDYFVIGIALALVAYLGKDMRRPALIDASWVLESFAVVSFALAAYCGLQRIANAILTMKQNARYLHEYEAATALTADITAPLAYHAQSGGFIDLATRMAMAAERREFGDRVREETARVASIADRYYRWRDRFLYAGIAALTVGRFFL